MLLSEFAVPTTDQAGKNLQDYWVRTLAEYHHINETMALSAMFSGFWLHLPEQPIPMLDYSEEIKTTCNLVRHTMKIIWFINNNTSAT